MVFSYKKQKHEINQIHYRIKETLESNRNEIDVEKRYNEIEGRYNSEKNEQKKRKKKKRKKNKEL